MQKAKFLKELIETQGYTIRAFAQKCGIPESTLYTILKKGVGRASVNTIILICKNLGITVEQLEEIAEQPSANYKTIASYIVPFELSHHEAKVITAYHDQPDMQPAIDKLLGVTRIDEHKDKNDKSYLQPIAAHYEGDYTDEGFSELRKDIEKFKKYVSDTKH